MFKVRNTFVLIAIIGAIACELITLPSALASETQHLQVADSFSASKTSSTRRQLTNLRVLENAFSNRVSNVQVLVFGRVISVLSDDTNGDRHQRFVVQLSNSQTLLVAHNVDIAPRVSNLRVGDQLYIYGEYEWNSQGGVIHWTHHDPNGRHVNGWIEKNGVVFQ